MSRNRIDAPGIARSTRPTRPVRELLVDEEYRAEALQDAVNRLRDADEDMSASVPFNRTQKIIGFTMLGVVALLMVFFPVGTSATLVSVATVAYVITIADRLVIFRRGLVNGAIRVTDEQARSIPDEELPSYTVFVPAYGEPEVVGELVAAMETIEYPREKLQVLLLLEEDDEPTIAAARDVERTGIVTVVLTPPAQPRTKPKACNYGMHFATGDIVTIFDAEDKPEPLQLRRAVYVLNNTDDESVVCVQGKLSFHNVRENLLTEWFTADYGIWFGFLLPGMMVSRAPIPLGGTSNHFKRDVLDRIGAWDPFNVTEDADLGVRIADHGYRTVVLDSVTMEEANVDAINWVRQRSRWYKGYMQTWLVHMRHPVKLWDILGPVAFARFTLLIAGTPLIACLNMVFWLILALWISGQPMIVSELFPGPIYYLALASMILGNGAAIYMNLIAIREDGRSDLLGSALLIPLYWLMMSVAAIKGMWQILVNPSYWEKTYHGLSTSHGESSDSAGPGPDDDPDGATSDTATTGDAS
ncbi:putative glycosyltransferase [Gordonia namibiensis NBRC 108229]|uniref:Putative glycosyltransferase n=1 Tax=Gordonia namibiensis NBRC 108229 TaxID=1208314 RepID=K6WZ07_9ACTN|nr:glycosyltransferase [Gordonia namibiensis]GAB99051.1 putative glycosyltransferase [Gordonia namibiensis NBRC 108229]